MDGSGVGGGGGADLNPMLSQNSHNNNSDLDSLSNLLINSYEDDAAALDQYESELEQNLQENLLIEKEQSIQRLFQSFQTSACNVAQMFKDKSSSSQTASVTSSWESFQNAAGAITVLYKDSLEACKTHMELGVHLGQQRKLKDLISFIKKKKNKRSIRKDELISFLIGKQCPSSQNQMFNLFSHQAANSVSHNPFNLNNSAPASNRHRQINRNRSTLVSSNQNNSNANGIGSSSMTTTQPAVASAVSVNVGANSSGGSANTNPTNSSVNNCGAVAPLSLPIASQLSLINSGDNSNGSEVETNSDLATFREALIMHNRSRDTPLNRTHATSQYHNQNQNHHHQRPTNHSHQCQTHNGTLNPNNNTQNTSSSNNNTNNNQSGCDDLDCFFCEQIATHIEHKRSSAQLNFDMESPTRKRSRFY